MRLTINIQSEVELHNKKLKLVDKKAAFEIDWKKLQKTEPVPFKSSSTIKINFVEMVLRDDVDKQSIEALSEQLKKFQSYVFERNEK